MTAAAARVPGRGHLLVITGLALALRAAALLAAGDPDCLLDECSYRELATAWAEGRGFLPHAGHYWPPGYVAFLAGHLLAGAGLDAARLSQVLLGTLLVPLVWAFARAAAAPLGFERARRAGLIAAAVVAVDPTLIAFTHYFWTETLFLPLFTAGLLLALAARQRGDPTAAAGGGLLLGLAALVKVLPLYLAGLLALWLLAPGESPPARRRRAAALLLAGTFVAVAPWIARNAFVHQRLVLIETTTGKNLVRGNNPWGPSNWDWGAWRRHPAVPATACNQADLVDRDACLTAAGLGAIAGEPGRFFRQAATKIADLVNPTSFLVRHIRLGAYGAWPRAAADSMAALIALFNMSIMALALVGWQRAPPSPARSLVVIVVLYWLAVHTVTFGMSRFRLPMIPVLAAGAALAIVAPRTSHSLRSRLVTLGLLALLAALWAARVGTIFHVPAPGESLPSLGTAAGGDD